MEDVYRLWRVRAKRYGFTPLWVALVTLIFAPLGYWFLGDGYRGIKYAIVLFFAGYLTLGIGSLFGSILLAVDVYRRAANYEKRYPMGSEQIEHSQYGRLYKGVIIILLLTFIALIYLVYLLTSRG